MTVRNEIIDAGTPRRSEHSDVEALRPKLIIYKRKTSADYYHEIRQEINASVPRKEPYMYATQETPDRLDIRLGYIFLEGLIYGQSPHHRELDAERYQLIRDAFTNPPPGKMKLITLMKRKGFPESVKHASELLQLSPHQVAKPAATPAQ